MQEKLQGKDKGLRGFNRFHLATDDGSRCLTVGSVAPDTIVGLADTVTTTGAGVPQAVKISDGPIKVAGRSYLTADVTTLGPDTRAFYALSVGTSPADARIVQNNVLPQREPEMITDERRRYELPSVAVEVPKGESLFLTVTPVSDMFAGFNSRTPGVVQLSNMKVRLPTVG